MACGASVQPSVARLLTATMISATITPPINARARPWTERSKRVPRQNALPENSEPEDARWQSGHGRHLEVGIVRVRKCHVLERHAKGIGVDGVCLVSQPQSQNGVRLDHAQPGLPRANAQRQLARASGVSEQGLDPGEKPRQWPRWPGRRRPQGCRGCDHAPPEPNRPLEPAPTAIQEALL